MSDYQDEALLSNAFAEFSDEVAPQVRPAGTVAAHETVRFRRRVRVGAATAAAAFLVAVPVAAYAVTAGDPDGPPVDPGTPSPTHETSPSQSPETQPSPSQESSPSPEAPSPEVPELAGQLFYMDASGALYVDGQQYPGGSYLSLNVSPDGRRVAWVDDNGDLQMSDLDGSNRRTVHNNVDGQCVEPVWSSDSTRLLIHQLTPQPNVAVLYLAGGAGDHIGEAVGCHYRWSADGERLAVLNGDLSGVTVMDLDGGDQRVVNMDAALDGRVLADLTSISADGGRISIQAVPADSPVGDVARSLVSNAIIDVETGEEVTLPVDGALRAVLFQPDGGTLVRVDTAAGTELVLLDAVDRVVARTVESAATTDLLLLSYTG